MPTQIRYNGEVIATIEPGKGKVLECSGMKMKSDIVVSAPAYQTKTINPLTQKQTILPGEGFEAFSEVTVDAIKLQEKTVTDNGEITPDAAYDGLSKVIVNVPIPEGYIVPEGTLEIISNGSHDVNAYALVDVNVEPILQEKTVTENGEVTPDEGYNGLSKVDVRVPEVEEWDGTIIINGGLISFTIDGVTYQAEEGMTWGEWVENDYNADNYYANSSMIFKDNTHYVANVITTDTIISGMAYTLYVGGGLD